MLQYIELLNIDGRPKPENVHQNLFDGIFCYKLPTEILFKYMQ